MAEYIEREAAKKEINLNFGGVSHAVIANRLLDAIPAADVVPVVHGQWIEDGYNGNPFVCSYCGHEGCYYGDYHNKQYYYTNYCPNCGARMDGE